MNVIYQIGPLSLAVLAALPLLAIFWHWSLVRFSIARKIVLLLLRTFVLLLVAAGLANPRSFVTESQPILAFQWKQSGGPVQPPAFELAGPEHVRAGEQFSLDLLVRSKSNGTASVELLRDGQPLAKETLKLAEGENRASFPAVENEASQVVYEARVQSDQIETSEAGTAGCAVYIDPPPKVLVVESQPQLAEHLQKALATEVFNVEVRPELPAAREQLAAYDLVILGNVPASALGDAGTKALQTYVHDDRGGLIAVGGDRAFTVGGYRHTPLEDMLPVISEPRKNKPKQTLAMVLVVDISDSMNDPTIGNPKVHNIDLAKQALRTAVGMLGPRDQVGVLVFEDHSRWIWPLAAVTDKQPIIDKINTIKAEGSTNMYPPLEKAYLSLREAFADLKHIIVMTDGLGEPGDFDGLARKMADAGITISTVGVGDEPAHEFLQSIADRGKGRAYFCPDGERVPKIFETETNVAGKIGITEEPFFPQSGSAAHFLAGLDMSHAPALLGYVETEARLESRVVLSSKTGEPILATWKYGGGTTAAFTSDIQSRWAGPWLNWPGFAKFWVQLVRDTIRHDLPRTVRLAAEASDGRLHFTLDAADREGHFVDGAEVTVIAKSPLSPGEGKGKGKGEGSKTSTTTLTQIAPGLYAGSQSAGQGTYWLKAEISRNGRLIDSLTRGTVVLRMPDTSVKTEGSLSAAEKSSSRTMFLWPWLLGAGLVVLVIDLTVRRTGTAK